MNLPPRGNANSETSTVTTHAPTKSALPRLQAASFDTFTSRSVAQPPNAVTAASNYQAYVLHPYTLNATGEYTEQIFKYRSQPFDPANTPPPPSRRRTSPEHMADQGAATVCGTGSCELS